MCKNKLQEITKCINVARFGFPVVVASFVDLFPTIREHFSLLLQTLNALV